MDNKMSHKPSERSLLEEIELLHSGDTERGRLPRPTKIYEISVEENADSPFRKPGSDIAERIKTPTAAPQQAAPKEPVTDPFLLRRGPEDIGPAGKTAEEKPHGYREGIEKLIHERLLVLENANRKMEEEVFLLRRQAQELQRQTSLLQDITNHKNSQIEAIVESAARHEEELSKLIHTAEGVLAEKNKELFSMSRALEETRRSKASLEKDLSSQSRVLADQEKALGEISSSLLSLKNPVRPL